MQLFTLTDNLTVGEPPSHEQDIHVLVDQRFRSLLNLRSLDEEGDFSSREEGLSARNAGLNYLNYPVVQEEINQELVSSLRTKIDYLPEPVYVHGADNSKAFALSLIVAALEQHWTADETLKRATELEFPKYKGDWDEFIRNSLDEEQK